MKAIRVITQCDCEVIEEAVFERMCGEGFSPVMSRAGLDWFHFEQDQVKIITHLQKALEPFDPCEFKIVEQVEYAETYQRQDFSDVLNEF